MPGIFKFDEAPDILSAVRRSTGTGIGIATKSVSKLDEDDSDSPIAKLFGVPVGFQFGTYLGLKGWGAAVTDVITDPLAYIPIFGWMAKGVRGLGGLTKAGMAATAAKDIVEGLSKHPAAGKLLGGLFDEGAELAVKGMPVKEVLTNMRHGFHSAASIAGNEEVQALVKEAFEKHGAAMLLEPGKAQRKALNEVEQIMAKARKVIRNDSNAGTIASSVFSSKNLQGFHHAIRMRQEAILAPLGETMAEQAFRGQRKLIHGYVPFSEFFTQTGAPLEAFSVTGAPLMGAADVVGGIAKAAGRPVLTGFKALDPIARKVAFGSQAMAKLSVTADDVVASANRAVEATTGRMFTQLRQEGGRLVAPGVWSSGMDPAQVFIKGPEGKSIPYLAATATDRIQAALHASGDGEAIADNFVAAVDTAKFEVDRLTAETRAMLSQVHGGGEVGERLADARARLMTLAWQSPADEVTGINGAGLIPVVTERVSEGGVRVPLVQFTRPGEAAAFASGADLNLALDAAKGVDPAVVAKPFGDEELLAINTMAESMNRMGIELANEGLKEEFVKVYGPRIVTMTPKGRATYGKGLGKIGAAVASAAEESSLPEEIMGAVKSAFDFNPAGGSAGRGFLKERRASWDYLLKGERDGLWTLEHDALKSFNRYMKSAGEVIHKQGYLKGLRGLGEDAFGRVVMNADEVEKAGGLARLSVTGPTQIGAGVFKASKETTPTWKFVSAESIAGFNTEGQKYFIREDIHSIIDKLPQFKPGGLFLTNDKQSGQFITGLLAINAVSKRAKVSLSQFHKFVLAGSLVSDQGLGLFFQKAFDPATGKVNSTLNLDVLKAAGIGGVRGAAAGAVAGAALDSEDRGRGALKGAAAAFLPGAAFRSAKEFARIGAQVYGEAADIATTGIKAGLTLDIDDAGLTTLDRMVHTMGTTPIPRLTSGGARQRAFVRGVMQPVEHFDKDLWKTFYPGAKVMAFGNLYAEMMAENVKRGLGLTAEQVAANAAHHVNRAMGGLAWRKLGVSPQFRRLMNGMWFAADWTTSNLLMARDVFVNMTPARTALAGSITGVAANAVVNGFDRDNMSDKGLVASAILGGAGALAFRGAAFAFGQKIGKDIVRGTPLQEWMVRNTASLADMRDLMEGATEAYKKQKGVKLVSQADPEFAHFAVGHVKQELEKAGKFLPEEFIPGSMKSGADELTAKFSRRYAKNALISLAVMGNIANYAMTGRFMWENDDGHKLDVELPGRDSGGRKLYMAMGKQYAEPFEWVTDPGHRAKSKLSVLLQTGIDLGSNQDFMGRPIIQMDGGFLTQGYEASKYALTEMFAPIPFEPLIEAAQGKRDVVPAALSAAGVQVRTQFKAKKAKASFQARSLTHPPSIGRTSLRPGEDF